jgi:hypothetical protein
MTIAQETSRESRRSSSVQQGGSEHSVWRFQGQVEKMKNFGSMFGNVRSIQDGTPGSKICTSLMNRDMTNMTNSRFCRSFY